VFFWDLKYDNIGYDDDFNCIMIDYDDRCVRQYPVNHPYWYGGTYCAVYITCMMALGYQFGYNTQQIKWENDDRKVLPDEYHDKLGIGGLPNIIFKMFFEDAGDDTDYYGIIMLFGKFIIDSDIKSKVQHPSLNFYDHAKIRAYIQHIPKIYRYKMYDNFYNDIYNLLIDNDATGILSLYYHKVPTYEQMITTFEKYMIVHGQPNIHESFVGGHKKYILLK